MTFRATRCFAAAALFTAIASFAACSTQNGTTPSCIPDETAGKNSHVDGGCNPFPVCQTAPNDPAKCCEGKTGQDFQNCLYGYGVPTGAGGESPAGSGGGGVGGAGTGGSVGGSGGGGGA